MRCCAGIVLYNPNMTRLEDNINAIRFQVDKIILVDNNSANINEIIGKYSNIPEITILTNGQNKGISTALNQICQEAYNSKFEWVYLLDQDSISHKEIITIYSKHIDEKSLALLTPFIVDVNKMTIMEYEKLEMPDYSYVDWAITSGSFIKLDVWRKLGGFDESLFIDCVDLDYSKRLKLNGYKQKRINHVYLLQEVGDAQPTFIIRPHKDNAGKWSLKRYYRSNHSMIRNYYMIRNRIILIKKYRKYDSLYKELMFFFIFTLARIVFEKDKFHVCKHIIKGILDGIKFDVQQYKI